jgi:hypothetical protein
VYGGHPVATVRPAEKQLLIATYFAHADLAVARRLGADWVVYGPPASQQRPSSLPNAEPAYVSGEVRVYRVPG